MKFTVFGSGGFIGGQLATFLKGRSSDVLSPTRADDDWLEIVSSSDLGHVFYCIGLTGDFRTRPFDTVEAHVGMLSKILQNRKISTFTYLSSTRVYEGADTTSESGNLILNPAIPGHLYNLSKLMGESLCLNSSHDVKVIRLSNVYGMNNNKEGFLGSILSEAASNGSLILKTAPNSSKDYISIDDAIQFIPRIALEGRHRIYNLASGSNTSNHEIANALNVLKIKTHYMPNSAEWSFLPIKIGQLESEFGKPSKKLIDDLPELLNYHRKLNYE